MFYLRNISKCERYTEIVLHLYFPHAVSVVWITSRIVGALQHPRGIWDWATTKIRCCRKKWEGIYLQEPLQNCAWAVCASSTAFKRQIPCWLQVIVYRNRIKNNICFGFRFAFMLDLEFLLWWISIHGVRLPSSGWAGNTWMLSAPF